MDCPETLGGYPCRVWEKRGTTHTTNWPITWVVGERWLLAVRRNGPNIGFTDEEPRPDTPLTLKVYVYPNAEGYYRKHGALGLFNVQDELGAYAAMLKFLEAQDAATPCT